MTHIENDGTAADKALVYSATARRYHWWTAALVLLVLPLGLALDNRANDMKIFDATTKMLESTHKLLGFIVLWVVIARLAYRLMHGAPASEPGLPAWQKGLSHATHWLLYLLLVCVPIGGWIGVSMYGSRDVFGLFSLPAIASINQKLSELVFAVHGVGGKLVLLLVGVHIVAALYHRVIVHDGVLRRMWPDHAPPTR